MIRRLHKNKNISKKKYFPAARVVLFYLTRPTGNDFLLKGGLTVESKMRYTGVEREFDFETPLICPPHSV